MCLICMDVLENDSMKPCKLKIHLETKHKKKKKQLAEYFRKLCDAFQERKTVSQIFSSQVSKMNNGLLASYEISKLIAKSGKPHNIGDSNFASSVCYNFISYETKCK